MTENRAIDGIVTKFLLNTTRVSPRPTKLAILKTAFCASAATQHPPKDKSANWIPVITGSAAEFYIEPMLPHVGDIDLMVHADTQLAIPRGHPPPTQLPDEFHNNVKVFEIIDSHLPGYVYLELRYVLTKCTESDRYNVVAEYDRLLYVPNAVSEPSLNDRGFEIHGPAVVHPTADINLIQSSDEVHCVRCLLWPSQAADWPTRHRNYGWPDSATVDRVVNNGCDVVGVPHRQCRQHEWMGKYQSRLSFSRAEVVLMNSWTPVQQIVYHMLRVFVKTERLTESADNSGAGTLSNYQIKTLMLWACELKPRSWWTDDLSLVRISVQLLRTFAVWLSEARCKHYFISNCNIIDDSFKQIASRLLQTDKAWLSSWFVNNYIRRSSEVCPESVPRLLGDVSTSTNLERAVSAVVQWRVNAAMDDMWEAVNSAQVAIACTLSTHSVSERSCVYWLTELSKLHECFPVYFAAFTFLHIVLKVERSGFNENLMKVLTTTIDQFVASSAYYNELSCLSKLARKCQQLAMNSTELNTSELVELLQQSAVEHLTTFRQIVERDFGSVATVVTTDFEALYAYKRGDYQQCLQLSTQNVHTLLYAIRHNANVMTYPEFIQLLDDDIVSLTALTLIVNPKCRNDAFYVDVTQLTLSLYLMTQCQLKLRHSLTSLAYTFGCIELAQRRHPVDATLNQLTLKLSERKIIDMDNKMKQSRRKP